jgi:hypothetical protein
MTSKPAWKRGAQRTQAQRPLQGRQKRGNTQTVHGTEGGSHVPLQPTLIQSWRGMGEFASLLRLLAHNTVVIILNDRTAKRRRTRHQPSVLVLPDGLSYLWS